MTKKPELYLFDALCEVEPGTFTWRDVEATSFGDAEAKLMKGVLRYDCNSRGSKKKVVPLSIQEIHNQTQIDAVEDAEEEEEE